MRNRTVEVTGFGMQALRSRIQSVLHGSNNANSTATSASAVQERKDREAGQHHAHDLVPGFWAHALDVAGMVLAGGVAGCTMWAVVLPIDAAKTRVQAATKGSADDMGMLRTMRQVHAERGVRGLWAGLGPTLIRAFPANAAQWLVWELTTSLLQNPD
jgi:Mitochondrial carrier protein